MMNTLFLQGAEWVRVDFHLHTRADSEFTYTGEDNFYNSNYVDALEEADIRLGIITNHNKFDFDELRHYARLPKKKRLNCCRVLNFRSTMGPMVFIH